MLSRHWNDSGSLTAIESRYINFLCMLVVYFNRAEASRLFCCESCTSKRLFFLEGIRLSGIINDHIPKLEYDMIELYI